MTCACQGGGPEGLPRPRSCSDSIVGANVGPTVRVRPSQTQTAPKPVASERSETMGNRRDDSAETLRSLSRIVSLEVNREASCER